MATTSPRWIFRCAKFAVSALCLLAVVGCSAPTKDGAPEAWSLDGRPLYAAVAAPEVQGKRLAELAAAEAALAAEPRDADALIWVGRRLGYLGRFGEAIATFTRGVERFPDDARFLRHRGHRWISVRRFATAIADLEAAARSMLGKDDEVEPDGQPNARNVPTGTLHFNVYYHLALAHFLAGDFGASAAVWAQCQGVSHNADKLVATSFWQYLTLRRLGRDDEAAVLLVPIAADLDVIENHGYFVLLRAFAAGDPRALLDGGGSTDTATLGNGVATWLWLQGERAAARAVWQGVVERTPWSAFGHIAAEAALARWATAPTK